MSLSNFAIRRPATTAMCFIGLGLLGGISLERLSLELLPEVVYPEIFVSLTSRDAAPEQVERDLLIPVEEEIGKLEGVLALESSALLGRGIVRMNRVLATLYNFPVGFQSGGGLPALPPQAR